MKFRTRGTNICTCGANMCVYVVWVCVLFSVNVGRRIVPYRNIPYTESDSRSSSICMPFPNHDECTNIPYPCPVRPRAPSASTYTLGLSPTRPARVPPVSVPTDLSRHSHQLQLRLHKTKNHKLRTGLECISSRAIVVHIYFRIAISPHLEVFKNLCCHDWTNNVPIFMTKRPIFMTKCPNFNFLDKASRFMKLPPLFVATTCTIFGMFVKNHPKTRARRSATMCRPNPNQNHNPARASFAPMKNKPKKRNRKKHHTAQQNTAKQHTSPERPTRIRMI